MCRKTAPAPQASVRIWGEIWRRRRSFFSSALWNHRCRPKCWSILLFCQWRLTRSFFSLKKRGGALWLVELEESWKNSCKSVRFGLEFCGLPSVQGLNWMIQWDMVFWIALRSQQNKGLFLHNIRDIMVTYFLGSYTKTQMQDVLLLGVPCELGCGGLIDKPQLNQPWSDTWAKSTSDSSEMLDPTEQSFVLESENVTEEKELESAEVFKQKGLACFHRSSSWRDSRTFSIERKFCDPLYIATQPSPVCLCVCVYRLAVTESRNS